MPDPATVGGFLVLTGVVSVFWGLSLWYFDERSQALRGWVFFAMGFTHRAPGEVRALLLSIIYYGLGLLAAILFASAFGLSMTTMISFTLDHLVLTVLGIVGEISLTNLLVDLICRVKDQGRPEQFVEMHEIPWIKGLQELPPAAIPVAAALGGIVEEMFFRGVLLRILTDKLLVTPLVAVTIVGTLFCLEQLVQVRTAFQRLIIGSGCLAISLVGGMLVVLTGSIFPAILCHASFVIFFMVRGDGAMASLRPGTMEAMR